MKLSEVCAAYMAMDRVVRLVSDGRDLLRGTFEALRQSVYADEMVYSMAVENNDIVIDIA